MKKNINNALSIGIGSCCRVGLGWPWLSRRMFEDAEVSRPDIEGMMDLNEVRVQTFKVLLQS